MNLPCRAQELLPHRGTMLLMKSLEEVTTHSAVATALVDADSPFVDAQGQLEDVLFFELAAQTYALMHGWNMRLQGLQPGLGYLVGVRSLEIFAPAKALERLRIQVNTVGAFEGFAVVDGEIWREALLLAKTRVKVFAPVNNEDLA